MKLSFSLLFAITLLCGPCFTQFIPYQSHSFNDLNYITQQLIKGIDAFKIDINSATKEACKTYSSWSGSESDCYDDQFGHKICCLAIKGDTSSAPKLGDYFNTTTDLISLLQNEQYDFIWQKDQRVERYNRPVYLAINIQYVYNTTDQGKQWILTKDWLASLINTIQQRNLDIILILGRSAILNYYGPLCASQSSECDANAQTIINYNFNLQGDKPSVAPVAYGVIDNFNIPFPSLPSFCSSEFPAYGDSLPYFFYEVAHELDIQTIYNEYTSNQCNKPATHPDLTHVRITSNTDPEMLENYLPKSNPLADLQTATNILIETFDQDHVLLAYLDTSASTTHIQLRSLQTSSFMTLLSEVTVEDSTFVKMAYKAPYLLLQNEAGIQIYSVSTDSSLALESVYNSPVNVLASDFVVLDNVNYVVKVTTGSSDIDATALTFVVENTDTQAIVYSQSVQSALPFDINEIQSAKLSAILDASNNLRAILVVSATYTNLGDDKDALFAYTIKTALGDDLSSDISIVNAGAYLDFGTDPDVKLVEDNGVIFVLEAHSNGLCQCADYLNNGNTYKCGIPNTQNPHIAGFQNMEYMLNYNWGKLDDIEQRILSGQFLSACDSQVMHAKYSNGIRPSGVVFRSDATGYLQALLVNEHIGYEDLPIETKLFCGSTLMPTPGNEDEPAVDVNTFNLVDYNLFEFL